MKKGKPVVVFENLDHNRVLYMVAIERGNYRAAARFALRELRRVGRSSSMWDFWWMRLCGCLRRGRA